MESKQHTPSVIAQLMGLDGLLPQHTVCKPHRVLSENYLQKSASIGLLQKRSYHERRSSFSVSYEEGQEFFNVFEVPEIPTMGKHCSNSVLELKNESFFPPSKAPKDYTHHSPSRIVVLKPNLRTAKNAARFSFSAVSKVNSQPNSGKHLEFSILKNGELDKVVVERKNYSNNTEPSGHNFRVSMHSINSRFREVSRTELRVAETSKNKHKVMMPACPSFFDRKNRCQTTYSPLSRSSFSKQAKKQLSERWKMTKSLQDVGVASKGTTLGEMLAMHDQETRLRDLNCKLDKSGPNNQFSLKESMQQNCSQKYSSKAKVSSYGNEKPSSVSCMDSGNNHIPRETYAIQEELENKIEKKDFSEESYGNCKISKSSVPRSDFEYEDQTIQGNQLVQDELKNSCGENILSGKCVDNSILPNSSISSIASSNLNLELVVVAETENMGISSGTTKKQQSEPVACFLSAKDGNSSFVMDTSVGQESLVRSQVKMLVPSSQPKIDPEFSMSLGEGCSPSPNSVLEPPFGEEVLSGSERFHGICTDLHGLWMQLQLLKSDSEETNSEGAGMVVSSAENSGDGSVDLSEENKNLVGLFRAEESRDFSYLVDILDEAGFYGNNLQLGFENWHSMECPLSPSVFEMLEKKYGEQTSWKKSERRLLFDRVNSGLKEILQSCFDLITWAKPLRKKFNLSQSREVIEEEVWMLLVSQEKEVSMNLSKKALGTEISWFELRDDIDLIASEMESFLFDELATELASIQGF